MEPLLADNDIQGAVDLLMKSDVAKLTAQPDCYMRASKAAAILISNDLLKSYVSLLPMLLRLNHKPYELNRHFAMEPMFQIRPAKETVLKCGRQLSKSTSLAAMKVITHACMRDFKSLYDYYETCVIGGDSSFAISVTSFKQFEQALLIKLIREIAANDERRVIPAMSPVVNCRAGE